jgi:hypothetical protein
MDGGVLNQISHPAVVALNAVSAGLDEVAYADVWSLSDDDLADALVTPPRRILDHGLAQGPATAPTR